MLTKLLTAPIIKHSCYLKRMNHRECEMPVHRLPLPHKKGAISPVAPLMFPIHRLNQNKGSTQALDSQCASRMTLTIYSINLHRKKNAAGAKDSPCRKVKLILMSTVRSCHQCWRTPCALSSAKLVRSASSH